MISAVGTRRSDRYLPSQGLPPQGVPDGRSNFPATVRLSNGSSAPAIEVKPTRSHGYIGGLDGLRALACMAVLLYHTWPAIMPGGFLGVDVFFVLSGFLITALLIREIYNPQGQHRINFVQFWLRRWRRLFPAVFTVCVVSIPLAWAADPNLLARIKSQLLGTLTFSYNWVALGTSSSYFDHGNPRLLTNMWTLSVEQQFYLVWPLALICIFLLPRRWRPAVPIAVAGISVALMAWFAASSPDPSRAYMGTDSHSFGLMLGAALAFLSPQPFDTSQHRAHRGFAALWGSIGILGLAGIITAFILLSDSAPGIYPWWTLLTVIASACTIHAMTARVQAGGGIAALLRIILDLKPLQWIGVRSYGIYLWHWPLLLIWQRSAPYSPNWLSTLVVATVATVCAALSFSLVENPMRRAGIIRTVRTWITPAPSSKTSGFKTSSRRSIPWRVIAYVATAIWIGLFSIAVIQAPAQSDVERALADPAPTPPATQPQPAPKANRSPAPGTPEAQHKAPKSSANSPAIQQQPTPALPAAPQAPTQPQPAPNAVPITGKNITIIGDSVVRAAMYALADRWPGITIDSGVSRQGEAIAGLISAHAQDGTLGHYVVVSNATNGKLPDSMLRNWLELIGKSRVLVLVTGHGPANDSWIAASNEAITRVARQNPQRVVMADWNRAAEAHPELLYSDGVHPKRPEGARYYCDMLAHALSRAQQLR